MRGAGETLKTPPGSGTYTGTRRLNSWARMHGMLGMLGWCVPLALLSAAVAAAACSCELTRLEREAELGSTVPADMSNQK